MISHEEILGFDRGIGITKSHDRDAFAFFDEVGGAAVNENFTSVGWAFENVGFESSSGGNRGNENFLARP